MIGVIFIHWLNDKIAISKQPPQKTYMKKSNNNRRYSIWIDKRIAQILAIDPDGKKHYSEIHSAYADRERFKGEKTDKIGLFRTTLSREKHYQQRTNHYHQKFIKEVVSSLNGVNALLIIGSGDTRFELQNAIEKNKMLNGIWIENKPSKKLTKRELEIETENHFNVHLSI